MKEVIDRSLKYLRSKPVSGRALALLLLCAVLLGILSCGNASDADIPPSSENPFKTFRDIPGITDSEIAAVERLQAQGATLSYATSRSTELFERRDGTLGGYTVLFTDWLSELFGVEFQPEIQGLGAMLNNLGSGGLDFATLSVTPERRGIYHMTDNIAQRSIIMLRLDGSKSIREINQERLPRYVFVDGSVVTDLAVAALEPGTFIKVIVANEDGAYQALANGMADAFIATNTMEAAFDHYGNMHAEDFLPLIYLYAAMTAENEELQPIISVVTKALDNGAYRHLTELYKQGYQDYRRHKFTILLSDEEADYLRDNPVIPFATQYMSYPISFYNAHEDKWDGIVFDIFDELRVLTGLNFEMAHDGNLELPALMALLENETAHFMPNLIHSPERAGRFDWLETSYLSDRFALLSKQSFPNVELNDISSAKVGIITGTAFADVFRAWFPEALYVTEYTTADDAFMALDRGEVELVMSIQSRLTALTNYYELSDYKANYLFNDGLTITFAVNKNRTVLHSILDKALRLSNTDRISEQWMSRTYSIEAMRLRAQRPWLMGISVLFLIMLLIVLVLSFRNRKASAERVREAVEEKNALREVQEDLANQNLRLNEVVNGLQEAEREIAERREFNRGMFNNAPVGLTVFDENFKFIDCNENVLKMYGVDKEFYSEFFGSAAHSPEYQPDGSKSLDKAMEIIARVMDGETMRIEWVHCTPNGEPLPVELTMTRIKQGDRYVGLGYIYDMREQHMLKDELKNALYKAEAASQTKSAFLANMSHEIRTPMNAILGITEIELQKETLPRDTEDALVRMYESGNLLLNIINDILDLSKIEAGKLEIMPVKYDIPSLINDAVQVNRMRYESKPIEFLLEIDAETPLNMFGDELRLKQILSNIISNAFKYTAKGTVKLSVSFEEANSGDDDVIVIFDAIDTGQGMTEEQVEKLFDEYTRFNMDANRTTIGTGLGMSISRHLVELMGGEISVKSELGVGSHFTVRVPQKRINGLVCGSELAARLQSFRFQSTAMKKKSRMLREYMPYGSVLIVDDVESNSYVAKGMLLPYGLEIDTVNSGFDAIEKVRAGYVYDIIFMDHMMPKMDGIEATSIIRGMGYTGNIIALTANALVGQAEKFLVSGFDGFISKPIDSRELNSILNEFIRDKKPSEVVESARQKQRGERVTDTPAIMHDPVKMSELQNIFLLDAENALSVFESIAAKTERLSDTDVYDYEIATHGMKNALANIGENELSAWAHRLEQAAMEKNLEPIREETSGLIDALKDLANNLRPIRPTSSDSSSEPRLPHSEFKDADSISDFEPLPTDREKLLHDRLLTVIAACEASDKDAAKAIVDELMQETWPEQISEALDEINVHLLHSAFSKAKKTAETAMRN